ncbi:MAG: hypothetical protein DHS20C18_53660 [Saprospiraceae bacterium]|nr:MAG: hypothetical protein DHS20C18_53660 [Saprospiraceae bacterium]
MQIKPFKGIFPLVENITNTDSFFYSVKEQYADLATDGKFEQVSGEALYVYRISTKTRNYTGLVACASVEDYFAGHIKQHEKTLEAKEKVQLELLLRRQACVKPILLTYPKVEAIQLWLANFINSQSLFFEQHFEKDEEGHYFWEVKEPKDIAELQALFRTQIPLTYIADGHHRLSTVAHLHQRRGGHTYQQLLCAFFPSNELVIHDFNRAVETPPNMSALQLMARLSQLFNIKVLKRASRPRRKHEIVMYLKKEWYSLHWKQSILDQYKEEEVLLDAALLNKKVLNEILEIEDVRTDQRINYVEGPKGLRGLQKATLKCIKGVGFCLYPVSFEGLATLAEQDKMLPPKSTWFEPRMRNGLIVQAF